LGTTEVVEIMSYTIFQGHGGEGPLLDHVQKRIEPRDTGHDDVRAAFAEVGEKELVADMADKYGSDGVNEMLYWNEATKRHGPNIAKDIGLYYATKARPAPEPEDDRREDDVAKAARAAFKQVSKKQTPEQHAAAEAGLRRLGAEHGNIRIADKFAERHADFLADPAGAALRTGRWIADTANGAQEMQQAVQTLNDYERSHRISPDERPIMQRVLEGNQVPDLASAQNYARWESAVDIKDPYERAVVAARRAQDGTQGFYAAVEVYGFDQRHPEARKNPVVWNKMRELLESRKAQDLNQAYRMAKR
jgi:hypothetical protein